MTQNASEAAVAATEPVAAPANPRRESKIGHMIDSIRHSISHEHGFFHSHRHGSEQPAAQQDEPTGSISPAIQAEQSSHLNENNMGLHSHEANSESWGWPGLGTYAPEQHPQQTAAEARRKSSVKPHDPKERRQSWGFPGLGTFDAPDEDAEEIHRKSCSVEHHRRQSEIEKEKQRKASLKPTSAAKADPHMHERQKSWGWPGLGTVQDENEEEPRRKSSARPPIEPRLEAAAKEAIDSAAEESYGWPGLGPMPAAK